MGQACKHIINIDWNVKTTRYLQVLQDATAMSVCIVSAGVLSGVTDPGAGGHHPQGFRDVAGHPPVVLHAGGSSSCRPHRRYREEQSWAPLYVCGEVYMRTSLSNTMLSVVQHLA